MAARCINAEAALNPAMAAACPPSDDPCPCEGASLGRFVQPAILCLLARGEMHGYQLIEDLAALPSFAGQKPDVGGVYRALNGMEARGHCQSRWDTTSAGPAKRLYQITPAGIACLQRWVETLGDYRASIDLLLESCDEAIRSAARTEPAEATGMAAGSPRKNRGAPVNPVIRRVRIAR